jgi:hypothetical protein
MNHLSGEFLAVLSFAIRRYLEEQIIGINLIRKECIRLAISTTVLLSREVYRYLHCRAHGEYGWSGGMTREVFYCSFPNESDTVKPKISFVFCKIQRVSLLLPNYGRLRCLPSVAYWLVDDL